MRPLLLALLLTLGSLSAYGQSPILRSGGALGTPSSGSAANLSSFPTLNQSTTGTAAGLTSQYIDWNAGSGGTSIANKPTIPSGAYVGSSTSGTVSLVPFGLAGNIVLTFDGAPSTGYYLVTFQGAVNTTTPTVAIYAPQVNINGSYSLGAGILSYWTTGATSYATTGLSAVVHLNNGDVVSIGQQAQLGVSGTAAGTAQLSKLGN